MQTLTEKLLNVSPDGCFSTDDLFHFVSGSADARHSLIKRAVVAGEIIRVRRGLYCLGPPYRRDPVNLHTVAQYIYGPSYISLESALSYHGWIPEAVYTVTSASVGESKTFRTPLGTFRYTRIPQNRFFSAVERTVGDGSRDIALIARPIKALADYVYAYRKDWNSLDPVVHDLRIDREDLATVSEEDLEEAMESYRSRRVRRFLSAVRSELGS